MLEQTIAWAKSRGWEELYTQGVDHILPIAAWSGHMSEAALKKRGFLAIEKEEDPALSGVAIAMQRGWFGRDIQDAWERDYAHFTEGHKYYRHSMKLVLRGDPVTSDSRLMVSLADEYIREKLANVLDLLQRVLPPEYELAYRPESWTVTYRNHDCLVPDVGETRILLRFVEQEWDAWERGIRIGIDTDVGSPDFIENMLGMLERTRKGIDRKLSGA